MPDLHELTATELIAGYASRAFTPVEAIDALAARIDDRDGELGAFTTLSLDRAREEAARIAPGDPRPLAGVPFAVKDLIDTAGVRTTYGSTMFRDHVPGRDAAVVAALRAAGALLIGKTQLHEFAWGITSVNERMGSSRNPWDPSRIPGGSSGGNGVALAARMVPVAIGTDTGGSIRIPSRFCGTTGLKPTYGRVSTEGVWPLAPSLDHLGPMTRSVEDVRVVMGVLRGKTEDRRQKTELIDADLSFMDDAFEVFAVIQGVEAARVHRRAGLFPDRIDEYGDDVRHRLEAAAAIDPLDYVDATRRREEIRAELAALLHPDRVIVTPVATVPPPRPEDTATLRDTVMPYTVPQNLAGLPTCAVSTGFDADGLPTGVQVTGAAGNEDGVLRAAAELQSSS